MCAAYDLLSEEIMAGNVYLHKQSVKPGNKPKKAYTFQGDSLSQNRHDKAYINTIIKPYTKRKSTTPGSLINILAFLFVDFCRILPLFTSAVGRPSSIFVSKN